MYLPAREATWVDVWQSPDLTSLLQVASVSLRKLYPFDRLTQHLCRVLELLLLQGTQSQLL
jgi:hypothetical protein